MRQAQTIRPRSMPATKPTGLSVAQCVALGRSDQDRVDYWEERAAIAEQDGSLPRTEAERQAFREVLGV